MNEDVEKAWTDEARRASAEARAASKAALAKPSVASNDAAGNAHRQAYNTMQLNRGEPASPTEMASRDNEIEFHRQAMSAHHIHAGALDTGEAVRPGAMKLVGDTHAQAATFASSPEDVALHGKLASQARIGKAWTDEARIASALARHKANDATNAALKATKGVPNFKNNRQLTDMHHTAANFHASAADLAGENKGVGIGGTADKNYHTKMAAFHRLAGNKGTLLHNNDVTGLPSGAIAEVASRHADLQYGDGNDELRTRVENAAMLHTLASKDPNSDSYFRGLQRKRGASMRERLSQIPKEGKVK